MDLRKIDKLVYDLLPAGQVDYDYFWPTTSIADAWEIWEHLSKTHRMWLDSAPGDHTSVRIEAWDESDAHYHEVASVLGPAPLAICLAALKAHDVPVPT